MRQLQLSAVWDLPGALHSGAVDHTAQPELVKPPDARVGAWS
jgi:hypothetical protein